MMMDPRKVQIVVILWVACLIGTRDSRHKCLCWTSLNVNVVQAFAIMPTIRRQHVPSKSQSRTTSQLRKNSSSGIGYHRILSSFIKNGGTDATAASATDTDRQADDDSFENLLSSIRDFTNKNFFLVGMLVAVVLAKAFPVLGQNNNGGILRPDLFIGNFGVTLIFLLSGLSLQTSELTQAISNVKMNGVIQAFIFAIWPFCIGVPLKILLGTISPRLSDGLIIMTTLPTTVNMCIMLTSACGGNVALSICNAVISNMLGIFITPLLLLHFFGATIQLPFGKMVWKLCQKVLLPVTVGQLLRATRVKEFYHLHSKTLKRLQEVILLGIVWNAFCNAFGSNGLGIGLQESFFLFLLLTSLHLALLGVCFKLFSMPTLGFSKADTIAAMFCASQKTLAFGLPLVNTIFQGNPNLASYCAPIMFIHPLQMMIGSFLIPTLQKYTQGENKDERTVKHEF
jgi:solute carrier family 10 (sodium/bile acid cotransporter), member 7